MACGLLTAPHTEQTRVVYRCGIVALVPHSRHLETRVSRADPRGMHGALFRCGAVGLRHSRQISLAGDTLISRLKG